MIKKPSMIMIYCLTLCCILVGMLGYVVYRESWIFPPTKPANMEELATWSELDIWRLMKRYNCGDIPWSEEVPDDLKELEEFCSIVRHHWYEQYDEKKLIDARKGADKLNKE